MEPFPARADADRLAAVGTEQAARFRDALRAAGFAAAAENLPMEVEGRARGGRNIPRMMRMTAAGRPLDTFVRLFLMGVPTGVREARAAMAPVPLEEWVEAGLVHAEGDSVRGLVALYLYEGLILAADKPELLDRGAGPDIVSGITNSTESLALFTVRRGFRNILDLGTGCGVMGFVAARPGGHLLATDVNARAIAFAQFNARLNGISDAEFATGDTFEPAAGRKFDLILANPPCVIGPAVRYAYRDSGMELDGLCRKIVGQAPEFLEEGGLFQSTAEWPDFTGVDWKERMAGWFRNSGCDALVLRMRTKKPLDHAEETVYDTDVIDAEVQSRVYAEYADYFERLNVASISEGLIAMRRRSGAPSGPGENWVRFEELPPRPPEPFGDAVWRMFEARDALDRMKDDSGLLQCKLRMAPELTLETTRTWSGEAWSDPGYWLRQGAGFRFQASVDVHVANMLKAFEGSSTVREVLEEVAARLAVSFDAVARGSLAVLREMLQRGFLVGE
jgi:methylase of polypeptide subunit release factors